MGLGSQLLRRPTLRLTQVSIGQLLIFANFVSCWNIANKTLNNVCSGKSTLAFISGQAMTVGEVWTMKAWAGVQYDCYWEDTFYPGGTRPGLKPLTLPRHSLSRSIQHILKMAAFIMNKSQARPQLLPKQGSLEPWGPGINYRQFIYQQSRWGLRTWFVI